MTSEINILADKGSLQKFYFFDQNYGWTRENGMLYPNLHFKDNVNLTEQGSTKLASLILATINSNITSPTCCKSMIRSYKNAVPFSFKNSDYMKRFDNRRRSGTKNVCMLFVFVTLMFVIILALWKDNHNVNGDVQHVSILPCGMPRSESYFHNHIWCKN